MSKRNTRTLVNGAAATLLAAALFLTGGCQSGTKDLFGRGKQPPDEFAVYTRAPLSLPPNYGQRPTGANSLPAPGSSGSSRVALVQPQDEARDALLGRPQPVSAPAGSSSVTQASAAPNDASAGTLALLRRTGGAAATSNVRAQVNRETQLLAEADQPFIERLMFWKKPTEYGTVVDPVQESKRIQQTQAMGEPIVTGQTPTIQRKPRGLLQGIIN